VSILSREDFFALRLLLREEAASSLERRPSPKKSSLERMVKAFAGRYSLRGL
jgi:hypothetical protein